MDYLTPFFTLSYPTSTPPNPDSFPDSQYYNVGPKDAYTVVGALIGLAIAREVVRLGIMEPFARWYLGIARRWTLREKKEAVKSQVTGIVNGVNSHGKAKTTVNGYTNGHANGHATGHSLTRKQLKAKERNVTRFAEQGWSFVYYVVFWSYGMYIHYSLPTNAWNPIHVWIGYPHVPIPLEVKVYYLTQLAFWFHQVLILNAEAHRKDHWQMMSHHFITIMLVGASYFTHFTRVGSLILVLMDFCDVVLPLAKMLRYLEFTPLVTDFLFGVFLFSWFVTRQVMFLRVVLSVCFDARKFIPDEQWPAWPMYGEKRFSWHTFVTLLSALQILMCIWFATICKVAWRVAKGSEADDVRSDDEDEDSEVETKKKQ